MLSRKINNVVGEPAERINGVNVLALRFRQQGGAPEVRCAVIPGELGAVSIAFGQQGFL